MNATHTPGPWKIGTFTGVMPAIAHALSVHPPFAVDGEIGAHICLVAPMEKLTPVDEANARLIAAAPELLDACRTAKSALLPLIHGIQRNECPTAFSAIEKLEAAIAKAEGAL